MLINYCFYFSLCVLIYWSQQSDCVRYWCNALHAFMECKINELSAMRMRLNVMYVYTCVCVCVFSADNIVSPHHDTVREFKCSWNGVFL